MTLVYIPSDLVESYAKTGIGSVSDMYHWYLIPVSVQTKFQWQWRPLFWHGSLMPRGNRGNAGQTRLQSFTNWNTKRHLQQWQFIQWFQTSPRCPSSLWVSLRFHRAGTRLSPDLLAFSRVKIKLEHSFDRKIITKQTALFSRDTVHLRLKISVTIRNASVSILRFKTGRWDNFFSSWQTFTSWSNV